MLFLLLLVVVALFCLDRIVNREFYRACKQVTGPPCYVPILGSACHFLSLKDPKSFFDFLIAKWKEYGGIWRVTFVRSIYFLCSNYRDMEVILSSNSLLEKGESYAFAIPWIGYGLLTSKGDKWKSRRKMLTPAFHFKILNQFVDVFNKNGEIMCNLMEKEVDGPVFDVYKYVQLAALDNIYETAMGVNMNVQKNPDVTYVDAIKQICFVLNKRAFDIKYHWNILFQLTKHYRDMKKCIEYVHNNTEHIIKQRRKQIQDKKPAMLAEGAQDMFTSKNKFAFLDMLLLQEEAQKLTDKDIREEVDTFMFEGHDTITSALSFTLYTLSKHQDVQDKIFEEQMEMLGKVENPSHNDLQNMKYLELVIKESQRLYPSVPLIERMLREDVNLPGGIKLPKNNQVTLFIYALHRDPEVWPNPDQFNPDNFLPEAVQKRNPFSYVPFSAGPRNCIGQKFAMLEMKCTLSKIIRKFRILPSLNPQHELQLAGELVLISKSGFHIKLQRRV